MKKIVRFPNLPEDFKLFENFFIVTVDNWTPNDKQSKNDLAVVGDPDRLAHAIGVYAARHPIVMRILEKALTIGKAADNSPNN